MNINVYHLPGLCLEKRVFYRLISGLHSSINIHLCAEYLLDGTAHVSFVFIPASRQIRICNDWNHPNETDSREEVVFVLTEGWGRAVWGPNIQEFRLRFDTAEKKGEGTRRLKNLYFLYLIELRALYKVAPYFERAIVNLYTGNAEEDGETKELLLSIFNKIK